MDGIQQNIGQKCGGHIGPRDRQPKDDHQQYQHQRETPYTAGQNAVEGAVKIETLLALRADYRPIGNLGSVGIHRFCQFFMEIHSHFPAQGLGGGEDVFGRGCL